MRGIKGSATRSDALVLFGASGDLAYKMIFPALYALARRGVASVMQRSGKKPLVSCQVRISDAGRKIQEQYVHVGTHSSQVGAPLWGGRREIDDRP
jgi:glucose-6-phosphate 1-dehydrogenase